MSLPLHRIVRQRRRDGGEVAGEEDSPQPDDIVRVVVKVEEDDRGGSDAIDAVKQLCLMLRGFVQRAVCHPCGRIRRETVAWGIDHDAGFGNGGFGKQAWE